MPKRQTSRRVLSDKAQGKGSWVDFKPISYGERKDLRAEADSHKDDETNDWMVEQETRLFIEHIIDWNWVGEDDQPLPVPSKDAAVLDGLTDIEYDFLTGLFESGGNSKK